MSHFSKTAVLHVTLNPVTGPWSVMRDLAVAQTKSGLYGAVGLGVIHSRKWPANYDLELQNLGLPFFKADTLESFGSAQFVWQRLQKPPIGAWTQELARQSGSGRVIVHFHNAWMSGVFLPLHPTPVCPVCYVATFHGVNAELDYRPLRRWLHRGMAARLPRHGARLTSVDNSNLPLAEKILGLNPALFTVIPNGVVDDPESKGAVWNGEGELTVGHIGSITERKGWRLAADAVLQLRAEGLKIRLIIAGSGSEEGQATQMAKATGGAIEFLGHIRQPRRNLFPRLHVLSVMSRHEGLPMTIIEAMAAGVPVVATAVGGIPEAVTDGETGFLIPRNVEALVKSLRQWHESPELWRRMSDGSRERFERQFEISHIVKQYDAIYRGMGTNETK
jgi:glycosyltransferase involved in cell wall biosynthesis